MEELQVHEAYMQMALQQAQAAVEVDEVPVGAVIVHRGRLIGAAHNQRQVLRDPTAHAEMLAITQAADALGDWRLSECALYVTLEPCPMCAGAIVNARIPHVIYGATDGKGGAVQSLYHLLNDSRLNHRCDVTPGIMAEACGQLLTDFFQRKREMGKKVRRPRNGHVLLKVFYSVRSSLRRLFPMAILFACSTPISLKTLVKNDETF